MAKVTGVSTIAALSAKTDLAGQQVKDIALKAIEKPGVVGLPVERRIKKEGRTASRKVLPVCVFPENPLSCTKISPFMLVAEEHKLLTIAQYLEMEDAAEVRHEFQNGKTIEMAGGTLAHNAIKGEIYTLVNSAIKSAKMPHMALNSDSKVRIEAANRFLYPDVTISDGTPVYYTTPDGHVRRDVVINPLVIVEVLSEETRPYDKGEKFELYCSVPGFQEYILIEPEEAWAKSLFLQDPKENLWKHEILTGKDAVLPIRSLGMNIPFTEIYAVLEKLPKTE